MAAKGVSSAIRSPTARASGRAHQGGRLQSEWVADFRRNRWPDYVGITGRFASDYAASEAVGRSRRQKRDRYNETEREQTQAGSVKIADKR